MVSYRIIRSSFLFVCSLFCLFIICFHPPLSDNNVSPHSISLYKKCIYDRFKNMPPEKCWSRFSHTITLCENRYLDSDQFSLLYLPNADDIKYVRLPTRTLQANDSCNIVTLGVGHDITVEKNLQSVLPPMCTFYGADPVEIINKELFESFGGHFFPLAVGAFSRNETTFVLGYRGGILYQDVTVPHIDIVQFLKDHAKIQTPIDVLLMDIEGREFEILPFLERGGLLDENNITVCQWNIEFHWPTKRQEDIFRRFVANRIHDERYLMLKAKHLIIPNMNRIILINMVDSFCVERYFTNDDVLL